MTVKMPEILKKIPTINKKAALRCLSAIAGAALFMLCQPLIIPLAAQLMGQAALFSTAITMPESTLQSLREHFAGNSYEDDEGLPSQPSPPASVSSAPPRSESSAPSQPPSSPPPQSDASSHVPHSPKGEPPDIPKKYQAPLITLTMLGDEKNPAFFHQNNVWLRNYTKLTMKQIDEVLKTDCKLKVGSSKEPQVLIYHTHTTESYEAYDNTVYDTRNSWRDTDNNNNMAAVGALLAAELEKQGISVIHDTEQHDYPSYNGAYDRSRRTMEDYLTEYPSIQVTIDLHRDGIVRNDNTVLKPVVEVNGKKAAQLMIIAPCDDGSLGIPNWRENLRFATELQACIDYSVPDLCRPIFFCYRNYNLGLTDASLLFELGTNGNTLDEALYTAKLLAPPIADVIKGHIVTE